MSSFKADQFLYGKKNLPAEQVKYSSLLTHCHRVMENCTQYIGTPYKASESAIGLIHYNIGLIMRDSVCLSVVFVRHTVPRS